MGGGDNFKKFRMTSGVGLKIICFFTVVLFKNILIPPVFKNTQTLQDTQKQEFLCVKTVDT